MTISARDLKKILYVAENTNFGETFAEMSGVLADRVHSRHWTHKNPLVCDTMSVAALFKWQGMTFSGDCDWKMINDCFDWLKGKISVYDLDEKHAEVKAVVERNKSIGKKETAFSLHPVQNERFSLLEI